MPITLAQAQVNTQSDVDYTVIDNFRRSSWLMDQIVFDDTVTPGTGGGSLTYAYTRLVTAAPAAFRAFNSEYIPGQATRQRYSVDLKPMGGAFSVDRVFASLGQAQTNETTFQLQQMLNSIVVKFQQEVVLGDTAVDANGFDGLDKILTGTSTELTTATNWTPATINTQALAMAELDKLDEWLSRIVASRTGSGDLLAAGALPPGMKAILGNTKSITRLAALARWAGIYTETKDDLGRKIRMYGDWFLADIGDRSDGSAPIIPITANVTAIYAVTFGLDGFHGASVANAPLMLTNLPNFSTTGAVKSGEAELGPVAVVLKNTKAAGVYRNITVQ
jgi:hypothetical protein